MEHMVHSAILLTHNLPQQREVAMSDEMKKSEQLVQSEATKARREFLKKAGKFSITAPMAALLLSVDSKRATAQPCDYNCDFG